MPADLLEQIRTFDKSKLRREGTTCFVNRSGGSCFPRYRGFVFVEGPNFRTTNPMYGQHGKGGDLQTSLGRTGRVYGYGPDLRHTGFLLNDHDFKQLEQFGRMPPVLIKGLRTLAGKSFHTTEQFFNTLTAVIGQQSIADQTTYAAHENTVHHALTTTQPKGEVMLSAPSLTELSKKTGFPAPMAEVLRTMVDKRFASEEHFMTALKEKLGERALEPIKGGWEDYERRIRRYNTSDNIELWPLVSSAMSQTDEREALAHGSSVDFQTYPTLRHEFVRQAWRDNLEAQRFIDERLQRGLSVSPEDMEILKARRLKETGLSHLTNTEINDLVDRRMSFFARFPGLVDRQGRYGNCNASTGSLLRHAARLQELAEQRQSLPHVAVPEIGGPSMFAVGDKHDIRVWEPVKPAVRASATPSRGFWGSIAAFGSWLWSGICSIFAFMFGSKASTTQITDTAHPRTESLRDAAR